MNCGSGISRCYLSRCHRRKKSEEKILHGVRGLFAEYERAKIAERFRLGKLRRAKDGHILLSEAPYGYVYIPNQTDRPGYIEVLEGEARTVRMMFGWVANDHLTLRQLVRRLDDMKIRPRKSTRGVWNTSTLSTLLRNRAYIGEAHWGSTYAVAPEHPMKGDTYRKVRKTSRRMKPKEEWIVIKVPAIIDKEIFDRARAQLDANYALAKRNKKNDYLLAGKIRCTCGRSRTGEGVLHGKHIYYRCSDRVLRFPSPAICKERGISASVADELVWNKLVELMSSPELMLSQAERWLASRQVNADEEDLASLKQQLTRYNKAYGAGLFTIEQLQEYTQPIKDRIATVETQTSSFKQAPSVKSLPREEDIETFAAEARGMLHDLNFSQKRAILLDTVAKVIAKPGELQIYGSIPIHDHVELQTSYRHSEDINQHQHVEFKTSDRHRLNVDRHAHSLKIPFQLQIQLPPPRTARKILDRDEAGRIVRSVPPMADRSLRQPKRGSCVAEPH
ncbi:site-specific DNA recombinase [Bradyrhizobium sp. USDA 4470]